MYHRVRCRSCNTRIGYHWIFGGIFNLLILVPFGILAFVAAIEFGLALGAALFVIGLAILNLLAARYGPLEAETRWWQS